MDSSDYVLPVYHLPGCSGEVGGGMTTDRETRAADPRRHERRDCLHYYPDGGCLDQAAKKDAKFIPCQACHFWEYGDNSAHNGDSELWREVYLMRRGG
jgi:hypothetical protein